MSRIADMMFTKMCRKIYLDGGGAGVSEVWLAQAWWQKWRRTWWHKRVAHVAEIKRLAAKRQCSLQRASGGTGSRHRSVAHVGGTGWWHKLAAFVGGTCWWHKLWWHRGDTSVFQIEALNLCHHACHQKVNYAKSHGYFL